MSEPARSFTWRDAWQKKDFISWPIALISGVPAAFHVIRTGGGPIALLADVGACGFGVLVGFGLGLQIVAWLSKVLKRKVEPLGETVFGLIFAALGAIFYIVVFQDDIHGIGRDRFYYVLVVVGIAILVTPFIVLFYHLSKPSRGA